MMNENTFNHRLDDLMVVIEDAIEESGLNIDYETSASILTLTFENDSKIILSRQGVIRQLWVAAKSGGFHFDFDEQESIWICDNNGETFTHLLNRCASEQLGERVALLF
ncbi:MAG: iron donor protein CyaY [Endozoicomonadaceae bacterium]|nr:iron donor protein CyaY [Endozoicomonadaceae bacterium]